MQSSVCTRSEVALCWSMLHCKWLAGKLLHCTWYHVTLGCLGSYILPYLPHACLFAFFLFATLSLSYFLCSGWPVWDVQQQQHDVWGSEVPSPATQGDSSHSDSQSEPFVRWSSGMELNYEVCGVLVQWSKTLKGFLWLLIQTLLVSWGDLGIMLHWTRSAHHPFMILIKQVYHV